MLNTTYNKAEDREEWACVECGAPTGFEAGTTRPAYALCEACYAKTLDTPGDCSDCGSAGTCTCEEDDDGNRDAH